MKKRLIALLMMVCSTVVAEESGQGPMVDHEQPTPCMTEEQPMPCMAEPCHVRQQFGYGSLGLGPMPIPLPTFALGYRTQADHHGMDLSLQASTIVVLTQVKANLLYHYYFKPSLCSQFYVGGGVGPSYLFGEGDHQFLISPEFVFGKQYRNESNDLRFFQAQVSWPTFTSKHRHHHNEVLKYPLVVISYGIGF